MAMLIIFVNKINTNILMYITKNTISDFLIDLLGISNPDSQNNALKKINQIIKIASMRPSKEILGATNQGATMSNRSFIKYNQLHSCKL